MCSSECTSTLAFRALSRTDAIQQEGKCARILRRRGLYVAYSRVGGMWKSRTKIVGCTLYLTTLYLTIDRSDFETCTPLIPEPKPVGNARSDTSR